VLGEAGVEGGMKALLLELVLMLTLEWARFLLC
jgi:hypothetical protein